MLKGQIHLCITIEWRKQRDAWKIFNFKHFVDLCLNEANLRDLIVATGLAIISNRIHILIFSACVILKFDRWPRKSIGNLFHAPRGYVYNFIATLKLPSGIAHIGATIRNCSHLSCHQELLISDQTCLFIRRPVKTRKLTDDVQK